MSHCVKCVYSSWCNVTTGSQKNPNNTPIAKAACQSQSLATSLVANLALLTCGRIALIATAANTERHEFFLVYTGVYFYIILYARVIRSHPRKMESNMLVKECSIAAPFRSICFLSGIPPNGSTVARDVMPLGDVPHQYMRVAWRAETLRRHICR